MEIFDAVSTYVIYCSWYPQGGEVWRVYSAEVLDIANLIKGTASRDF
jgi:hypothetical protein